jgi:acylphosphatase
MAGEDGDRVRCAAVVRGAVQGVGYRFSTIRMAERLGLSGWVANAPDRSVHVVAEGPRASVESLVAWLHRGPPAADVVSVDTTWGPAVGEFRGFGVR